MMRKRDRNHRENTFTPKSNNRRKKNFKARTKINNYKENKFKTKDDFKYKKRKRKASTSNEQTEDGPSCKKKEKNFKKKKWDKSKKQATDISNDVEFEIVPESGMPFVNVSAPVSDDSEDEKELHKLLVQQNRKQKKAGGFQSMGLSFPVFKGIRNKGYKIPTPIQRKCIPLIMEGKDVVAMARTGSGKTAAFLIPMFEKLKAHVSQESIRALILSPSRELALQTHKFCRELGKYIGMKSVLILGGDRLEDHFAAIHENPDIIIATPGRFLHVLVEMSLKLNSVEYVVFDEADRLFEMGFQEQLNAIIRHLPDSRQTLLFSATLPALLVDFAKAGLQDPVLIRLDVDSKLSQQLKTAFFICRQHEKPAALLYLLRKIVKSDELTMVFVATRHDVEYLRDLITMAGLFCSYIYSSLDQTERKIQLTKFQFRTAPVMIVTDVAARGIDMPMLDNVINYNFPSKPKLFIHRVGRVARAGRIGTAYSMLASDEMPYLVDLHLSLGRPLKFAEPGKAKKVTDDDGICGIIPQVLLDEEEESIKGYLQKSQELASIERVSKNGYKQYIKTRPLPSSESVIRVKEEIGEIGPHPKFAKLKIEKKHLKLLEAVKKYKPRSTIFEVGPTSSSPLHEVMKNKREKHGHLIVRHKLKMQEKKLSLMQRQVDLSHDKHSQPQASNEVITNTFTTIIKPSNKLFVPKKERKLMEQIKDKEFFIPYRPSNFFSEKGLEVDKGSFAEQASSAVLDLTGDEDKVMVKTVSQRKWDRKKKKFVYNPLSEPQKLIKTESGAWIASSYKKNIYKNWLERSKMASRLNGEDEEFTEQPDEKFKETSHFPGSRNKKSSQVLQQELKTKQEIIKMRQYKAKLAYNRKKKNIFKAKKKALSARRKT